MIPGANPKQIKAMMRQMGMSQEDIDAQEVIIKTITGKKLVFSKPTVQKVSMQGNTSFQITGEFVEEDEKAEISIDEEDITTVSEQAGVSKEEARKALDKTNGDIAQAIVNLSPQD